MGVEAALAEGGGVGGARLGEREREAHPAGSLRWHPTSSFSPLSSPSPPSLSSAAVLYAAASELLLQPKEYAAFAAALERVREDPRLTVRLGSPITGYGQEARSRAARQRISHSSRLDGAGVEHITVQFWARGPAGVARVTAEMHKAASGGSGGGGGSGSGSGGGDAFSAPSSSSASADVDGAYGASDWRYDYMVADVDAPSPQRIVIVAPRPAVGGVGAVPAGGGMRGGPAPRLSF